MLIYLPIILLYNYQIINMLPEEYLSAQSVRNDTFTDKVYQSESVLQNVLITKIFNMLQKNYKYSDGEIYNPLFFHHKNTKFVK